MTTTTTTNQINDRIDCLQRLVNLDEELGRMPKFKIGTTWHLDRLRARESVIRWLKLLDRS